MADENDETEPVAVRVPKELMARIRGLADREDRTIGKQVVRLLRIGAAIEEAEKRGLHSGHKYADVPHVSWPGYIDADDMKPLDEAWGKSEGDTLARLKQVWQVVK